MSVAPNGRIDVIWLDTRDNPGTYLSALYYSNSTDGTALPSLRILALLKSAFTSAGVAQFCF